MQNFLFRVNRYVTSRLRNLICLIKLQWGWALKRHRISNAEKSAEANVVVSLTSYPPRYPTLHLTLKSLLLQTVVPKKIVLWVAHEDEGALPSKVTNLVQYGLTIRVCENLRSYKKLIPQLQEDMFTTVVTADDDIYYWPDWLHELLELQSLGKKEVLCHRLHRINLNSDGKPLPYSEWDIESHHYDSNVLNFPTGIGGILYPSGIFSPEVLNVEAFTKLCPNGDDIWFYWMARKNGATFRQVPNAKFLHSWTGSQNSALWKNNFIGKYNDVQISSMVDAFGFFDRQ